MGTATVAQLAGFDEIIDVRSPAEYAQDHIPGAINCPVLDNAQRAEVGTLYKQASPFQAKIVGAALVARNIADHLDARFRDRPRDWRPLIYCWRGGNRSGAMAHVLAQVGWRAHQLEGGYKAWRQHVIARLAELPGQFRFRVICGPTGSGKSRLLAALAAGGEQVLDLEQLAAHRGSLLGNLPNAPQPAQKMFETRLFATLSGFDPARPVYAEAESKKIGELQVPDALLACLRAAACLRIEAPLAARVRLLMEDYAHFLDDPALIQGKLAHLTPLYGHARIAAWQALAGARQWQDLVERLLVEHYDPCYRRSSTTNYQGLQDAAVLLAADLTDADMQRMAQLCRTAALPTAPVGA